MTYNPMSKEFQDECEKLGLTGYELRRKYEKEERSIEKVVCVTTWDEIYRQKHSKEKLIQELIQFSNKNRRSPTCNDFSNNQKYTNYQVYIKIFGSWEDALREAGLKTNRGGTQLYSEKELLDILRQSNKDFGRPPTMEDFENISGYPHPATYRNRFGSWSNALKLVELDVDSMIEKGVVKTNQQKARLAEITIIKHFVGNPIDLAGENKNSSCDGICPNGMNYDVKGSKFYKEDRNWPYSTNNKEKDKIDIYYFLAFNENWTKLDYAWRVPGWNIINKAGIHIGISNGYEFNIYNMKKYEITEQIREVLNKYGYFEKITNYRRQIF